MKAYLLAAVGVIFLTVIISFVIPDGKLKKSVMFILRLACIAVMIRPVTGLFSFSETKKDFSYDYDYVCQVYSQNQSNLLSEKIYSEFGVDCVCVVEVIYADGQIKENGVQIYGDFDESASAQKIAEYLSELGYINISVNEEIFRTA